MTGLRMGRWRHWRGTELAWRLAAMVLLLTVGGMGCDPLGTFGFLAYPFCSNTEEPVFPLTIKGKESTVVFVCAHEENAAPDDAFRDADMVLCRLLTGKLSQRFKDNKDKVKIVPVSKVYSYLREHKDWITQPKQDIGKQFDADFLVYLELGPMTLWEPGSRKTLYRGNVEIRMSLVDVHQPEGEGTKPDQFYTCTFPNTYSEDASSMRPDNFRAKFLDRIANDLVERFISPSPNENFGKMKSD
jgi:hypothetical protein